MTPQIELGWDPLVRTVTRWTHYGPLFLCLHLILEDVLQLKLLNKQPMKQVVDLRVVLTDTQVIWDVHEEEPVDVVLNQVSV